MSVIIRRKKDEHVIIEGDPRDISAIADAMKPNHNLATALNWSGRELTVTISRGARGDMSPEQLTDALNGLRATVARTVEGVRWIVSNAADILALDAHHNAPTPRRR